MLLLETEKLRRQLVRCFNEMKDSVSKALAEASVLTTAAG